MALASSCGDQSRSSVTAVSSEGTGGNAFVDCEVVFASSSAIVNAGTCKPSEIRKSSSDLENYICVGRWKPGETSLARTGRIEEDKGVADSK